MVLDSVVSLAIKTIGNLLIDEGKFLFGVKGQAEKLQSGLIRLQGLLKAADKKPIRNEIIQQWIMQARDIAYDAEDLIESYAFKFASSGGFLKKSFSAFEGCYHLHKMGSELTDLLQRISELEERFKSNGVTIAAMEKEASSSTGQPFLRRSYSFDKEEDFVGLEQDVDLIVKHLVVGSHYRVVSICGMGGLGKTTLANKVYHHPEVKRHFNASAWVCVSQQWQAKDILHNIMKKLVPGMEGTTEKWTEEDLIRQILKIQEEKRCLIVLDDIWTEDAWESIKKAFPTQHIGTRILLTTRNRNVAEEIGPDGFHHEPRLLSKDESWNLLCKKLQRQRCGEGHVLMKNQSEIEELGKEMVAHCGCLPLAVVVLAGILSNKNTSNDWNNVLEHIKSILFKGKSIGKDKGEIPKILFLSYEDLPFQLKPCFLYLGSFREDVEILADTIYQMWIAEGMVLSEDRIEEESMMQLAERYLKELGQRGMVQLKPLELPGIRGFKSCRLHDLMRDLCLLQAQKESFLESIILSPDQKGNGEPYASLNESGICKLRRLIVTVDKNNPDRELILPEREIVKYLRMFQFLVKFSWRSEPPKLSLKNFEMLRVLSLEGLPGYKIDMPEEIGKPIHLRYLSLRDSDFDTLPSSLGNLKHLQTLDLRSISDSCRIPNILWKMKELTSLYLPYFRGDNKSRVRLDGLNKLEILEGFDSLVCRTEDLVRLSNLRALEVVRLEKWEDLELIANYAQTSTKLQHVYIYGDYTPKPTDGSREVKVLKQLFFGRNIHQLSIMVSKWKEIPTATESSINYNLVELRLSYCGEDAEETICETLEKFPHLRQLRLYDLPRREMSFQAMSFPQLQELTLYGFEILEKWAVEKGAMPNLRQLKIGNCRALKAVPDGLQYITTLEALIIDRMSQEFKNKIRTPDGLEGEDFHKISHVHELDIRD